MKRLLPILLVVVLCFSCQQSEIEIDDQISSEPEIEQEQALETTYQKGFVRLYLNEQLALKIESLENENTQKKVEAIDGTILPLNVVSMKRTFPYAGKFEARTRAEGLHRWYDVIFDQEVPLTRASSSFEKVNGVEMVEYMPKKLRQANYPFNDPRLPYQWHYYNDGTLTSNHEAGCDINVFPVWNLLTTGNEEVIVNVVDGGVDYDHDDLASNMWVNEAELNGTPGVDDDNNGYKDDVYGYNFVEYRGEITADDHGTHVAGTISAVNNNGKGVCGIAGGDYQRGVKGVRIQSSQIFSDMYSGDDVPAIKYGADNGAVISQNSWGYYAGTTDTPQSTKDAIDYFIKYAGIDESGNQSGPMKGGVVIFAAGNDDLPDAAPGNYAPCIAVAALAPDFRRSYYSNYGDWIDISAPGGDEFYAQGLIWSTISNNHYTQYQGTSMACPHVSGVAALIVSLYGGPGFTNKDLTERLLSTTVNIDEYNPGFEGLLGSGLVNAYGAMQGYSEIAPEGVDHIDDATPISNNVSLEWIVPEDEDDVIPFSFRVFYAKQSIQALDPDILPENLDHQDFATGDLQPGDSFTALVRHLDFNTEYFFRVASMDRSSNHGPLSDEISATTGVNNPPVITPLDENNAQIRTYQFYTARYIISDPDLHAMTWNFSDISVAVKMTQSGDTLTMTVDAAKMSSGNYTANLTIKDEYGKTDSEEISFTILENAAPESAFTEEGVFINGIAQKVVMPISAFFSDPDLADEGEKLSVRFTSSSPNVINCHLDEETITFTALGYGNVTALLTAIDGKGAACRLDLNLVVRDPANPLDIYPNPVIDYLYLRTGETKDLTVSITNAAGQTKFEGDVTASPFNPARISMNEMGAGLFNVTITEKETGTVYAKTITKI